MASVCGEESRNVSIEGSRRAGRWATAEESRPGLILHLISGAEERASSPHTDVHKLLLLQENVMGSWNPLQKGQTQAVSLRGADQRFRLGSTRTSSKTQGTAFQYAATQTHNGTLAFCLNKYVKTAR